MEMENQELENRILMLLFSFQTIEHESQENAGAMCEIILWIVEVDKVIRLKGKSYLGVDGIFHTYKRSNCQKGIFSERSIVLNYVIICVLFAKSKIFRVSASDQKPCKWSKSFELPNTINQQSAPTCRYITAI